MGEFLSNQPACPNLQFKRDSFLNRFIEELEWFKNCLKMVSEEVK